jgi:hypothetical protein
VDSAAGATPATVFTSRLNSIRDSVRELAALEASSTADSSGLSKITGFAESKAPKLGLMASEMETSQNIALYFLELRFGVQSPTASVTWSRDYDLKPVMDQIERLFDLQDASGLKSPTLGARLMMTAAVEAGLITPDSPEAETVRVEYETAAKASIAEAARQANMLDEFGRSGSDDPANVGAGPAKPGEKEGAPQGVPADG